jgi:Mn-dependent DtxR family transcriptional regulator
MTFTQWQVLETMRELIEETKDAVTQSEVAVRSGVDPMTVSDVMKKLERQNLVDRGASASGPAYQIWLKANGERLAAEGAERVEAVSVAWLEERARKGSR